MWLSKQSQRLLLNHSQRSFSLSKPNTFFPAMPAGQKIKRFYKKVDVIEHPHSDEAVKLAANEKVDFSNLSLSDKYYAVTLDGKVTKTMFKDTLLIPTKALALALAEEWEAQQESINLKSLHIVSIITFIQCIEQLLVQDCQSLT
jgi:hypothetical protein